MQLAADLKPGSSGRELSGTIYNAGSQVHPAVYAQFDLWGKDGRVRSFPVVVDQVEPGARRTFSVQIPDGSPDRVTLASFIVFLKVPALSPDGPQRGYLLHDDDRARWRIDGLTVESEHFVPGTTAEPGALTGRFTSSSPTPYRSASARFEYFDSRGEPLATLDATTQYLKSGQLAVFQIPVTDPRAASYRFQRAEATPIRTDLP